MGAWQSAKRLASGGIGMLEARAKGSLARGRSSVMLTGGVAPAPAYHVGGAGAGAGGAGK